MMDKSTLPDVSEQELEVLPIERSETIPASWYVDPGFHRFDVEAIFSRTWQYIGPSSQVSTAGDHVVASVAGNPIIIVQGNDNITRAFYNVCRHRGGPLALQDGNAKILQCKYHGWTYLLDGSLRGTPKFDRVELFNQKEYGLVPVPSDLWQGLVFVNLANTSAPLGSLLKGITDRMAPAALARKKFYRRIVYHALCNWKIYVDNYLEGYHLPFVHPELCNLLDYQNYKTETFDYFSLQHSPIQGNDNPYGSNGGTALYFFVWPNFMLNVFPNRLQTNLVIPTAHNSCTILFDYYYDDISSQDARTIIQEDIDYSDKVQQEDTEICEHVQKGLESRAYNKGRFSVDMEAGVYHFQSLLKRAYRNALLTTH